MELGTVVLIVLLVIMAFILYRIFKPYFIKYDSTLLFTGGLGSGKSLSSVKTAVILLRKQRFIIAFKNLLRYKIGNFFRKINNKRKAKYNIKISKYNINPKHKRQKKYKEIKQLFQKIKKPYLYSNIPIHFKKHIFGKKREWNKTFKASHFLCLEELTEYSIIFIDELPQFINQFNWNEELIKKNVNEFITFFRHYIGSYFITNAQSIDDVVVQIRRKLNQAVWCFDFKKWFFGLFYTIRMCDIMTNEMVQTTSTTFIEENTKLHFGLFPPKNTYDTRCYSERYKNIYVKEKPEERYKKLKTNKVLRLVKYVSPLDDKTTNEQKQEQWEKGEKIWTN